MKNFVSILALSFAVLIAGCKTAPEIVAYKTLGSIAISVQGATQAYYSYRDAKPGNVPPVIDDKLKSAYAQYQAAFAIAEQAQKIVGPKGTIDPSVMANVTTASSSFIFLVTQANPNFSPK